MEYITSQVQYKKIVLIIVIVFGCFSLISQNISITGPSELETGKWGEFTASLSGSLVDSILSYDWDFESIGDEVPGPSGIRGDVQRKDDTFGYLDFPAPYEHDASSTSHEVRAKWSDYYETTPVDVNVRIEYIDTSGKQKNAETFRSVYIYRVCPPGISGPSEVQKCCDDIIEYCVSDLTDCDANEFDWTVTGGDIIGSDSTRCIDVKPSYSGNFDVSCEVSRSTGLPEYTREGSKSVSRTFPSTPAISAPNDFICTDSIVEISVDGICGMDHISWSLDEFIEIVSSNSDSTIIEIRPTTQASSNIAERQQIKAKAIMESGCSYSTGHSIDSLVIYSSVKPPKPSGTVTLVEDPEGEEDPCWIYGWNVVFEPDTPFINGTVSITPTYIPNMPHRYGQDSISVSVCYSNPCFGETNCTYYMVPEPDTCTGQLFPELLMSNKSHEFAKKAKFDTSSKPNSFQTDYPKSEPRITVYPNPANSKVYISFPYTSKSTLTMYNVYGKKITTHTILNKENHSIDLDRMGVSTGVYLLRYKSKQLDETIKFIKQ